MHNLSISMVDTSLKADEMHWLISHIHVFFLRKCSIYTIAIRFKGGTDRCIRGLSPDSLPTNVEKSTPSYTVIQSEPYRHFKSMFI